MSLPASKKTIHYQACVLATHTHTHTHTHNSVPCNLLVHCNYRNVLKFLLLLLLASTQVSRQYSKEKEKEKEKQHVHTGDKEDHSTSLLQLIVSRQYAHKSEDELRKPRVCVWCL